MDIALIGFGSYGRAIGTLLQHNHVKFTPIDIGFPPLTHEVDVLLQMVPAQYMRQALKDNARFIRPDTIIINGAKGIEQSTHLLPYQIVQQEAACRHYFSLMGPSFAQGIIDKEPTLVSLGYISEHHLETVEQLLKTPYFRTQANPDYKTMELSGALKNVYAILCGYAEGLGHGMNTKAKLMTLALQEINHLATKLHGGDIDVLTPGVTGDLILTCSTAESRNYRFGKLITGMTARNALRHINAVVEGYYTSDSIQALATKHHVSLPVANLTHQLILGGKDAHARFEEFVTSV